MSLLYVARMRTDLKILQGDEQTGEGEGRGRAFKDRRQDDPGTILFPYSRQDEARVKIAPLSTCSSPKSPLPPGHLITPETVHAAAAEKQSRRGKWPSTCAEPPPTLRSHPNSPSAKNGAPDRLEYRAYRSQEHAAHRSRKVLFGHG